METGSHPLGLQVASTLRSASEVQTIHHGKLLTQSHPGVDAFMQANKRFGGWECACITTRMCQATVDLLRHVCREEIET